MNQKKAIVKLIIGFTLLLMGIGIFFVAGYLQDNGYPGFVYNPIGISGFLFLFGSILYFYRNRHFFNNLDERNNLDWLGLSGSVHMPYVQKSMTIHTLANQLEEGTHQQLSVDTMWIHRRTKLKKSDLYLVRLRDFELNPDAETQADDYRLAENLIGQAETPKFNRRINVYILSVDHFTEEHQKQIGSAIGRVQNRFRLANPQMRITLYYVLEVSTNKLYYEPIPYVLRNSRDTALREFHNILGIDAERVL